jgi:Mg2+ and Co2+ transporter CorA
MVEYFHANDSIYKDVKWVDLENPTSSEVRELVDEFDIAPMCC